MTLDSINKTEEAGVTKNTVIPDDVVDLEKGYYPGLYLLLRFLKGGGI